MTFSQIAVILCCLVGGYWIVSKLFVVKSNPVNPWGRAEQEGYKRQAPQSEPRMNERPHPPSWSDVLGISSSAGVDEIRHAYKGMIIQYHPDKVASLGLELRDLAEMKSKQITMAYQEGMRARGVDR